MARREGEAVKAGAAPQGASFEELLLRAPLIRVASESVAEPLRIEAGRSLFRKDDEADCFFLLDEGEIEISVISVDGRKLILEVLRPPAIFGEIGLFAGVRTADATALTDARLKRVRRAEFLGRLRGDPDLLLEVIDLLCGRLRIVSARLEDRMFLPLHVRVARRILMLLDQYPDGAGTVPMSQAELANFVGATREGVAKVLAPWRQLGWVEFSRGAMHVRDRAALETVAELSGP